MEIYRGRLVSPEEISKILAIFKGPKECPGALVIDEVDSVLDPIRSELNFPIGKVYPQPLLNII
jgi:hypothetical protein